MDRDLVRARAVEVDLLQHLGRERLSRATRPARRPRRWREVRWMISAPAPAGSAGLQRRQRLLAPGGGRAWRSRGRSRPASATRVPPSASSRASMLAAGRAEIGVGAVAQRQDGEAHLLEARGARRHQRAVEAGGARGRLALAPGGGDEQQVLGLRGLGRAAVGHVLERHLEALAPGRGGELGRDPLGVAGLGGVEDEQRLGRARGRLAAAAAPRAPRRGGEAGQEARKPGAAARPRRGRGWCRGPRARRRRTGAPSGRRSARLPRLICCLRKARAGGCRTRSCRCRTSGRRGRPRRRERSAGCRRRSRSSGSRGASSGCAGRSCPTR